MLIHPWDAALDPTSGRTGWPRPTGSGCSWSTTSTPPRRRWCVPAHFTLAGDGAAASTWPGRTRSGRTCRRPRRSGWPWSATTPTSRRTGGPRPAAPTRTACRPATTPRCSSCAGPPSSTTPRARRTSSPPNSPTSNPRAATPPSPSTQAPYGRMLSGIRGIRLPVLRVDAKFKYDDHNPVDHRERVIDQPAANATTGSTPGPPTQQQRRLDAIGDWRTPGTLMNRTCHAGTVPPWGLAVVAMLSVQLASALSVNLIRPWVRPAPPGSGSAWEP